MPNQSDSRTALAEELRSTEERYRLLANLVPDQVWTADANGGLTYVNDRVLEYFGGAYEDMLADGWTAVVHPDDLPGVLERWQHSLETGEGYTVSFRLRRADGQYRWHIGRALPHRDANGALQWFGTNTDVHQLRETEAARDVALADATAERQRLYEVFQQAPAAITVLEGPEHVFTVVNTRYAALVGRSDLIGRTVAEALPEVAAQGFIELLDGVYESGTPYSSHETLIRLDRGNGPEDVYIDFVYQPLKRHDGTTFGIMAHAVDVTEKVRAREAAETANRAKADFLAAMSHDLRTPLNAIMGYARLVADGMYGPVNEKQVDVLSRVQRANQHLLTLINDILSFSKLEAGSLDLQVQPLLVRTAIEPLRALIEPQLEAKRLTYEEQPAPEDIRVAADPDRIMQILLNLLTNAVKFTDEGTVSVTWEATADTVRINVQDTGIGISADELERVFDPFVQATAGRHGKRRGVGLGLAISRKLARAMNGDLTAVSQEGRGSTFTLHLPRA